MDSKTGKKQTKKNAAENAKKQKQIAVTRDENKSE